MAFETLDDLMAEIDKWLNRVGENLPNSVSAAALGVRSRAPYKALAVREALIWRTEELARGAFGLLKQDDLASAILLVRGVLECAALMARLTELISGRGELTPEALDGALTKMLLGWKSRIRATTPEPYNILTLVDHLDRRITGVRNAYDFMSEIAHPNWNGVSSLFSRIDVDRHTTYFGRFESERNAPRAQAANALCGCLGLFEIDYNSLSDLMPIWLAELEKLNSSQE
jgi:hypothetical protein